MSSSRFFNTDEKANTPIVSRHTRQEELKKEKFRETTRSLSCNSFFIKAPEELQPSHAQQNDPFSHDWVRVMWDLGSNKF